MGLFSNTNIDITRPTSTDLGNGSVTKVFSNHLTSVKAEAQPLSLRMRLLAGRKASSRAYNFYVAFDIDVTMKDHIIYNSEEYEILDKLKYENTYIKCYGEVINS